MCVCSNCYDTVLHFILIYAIKIAKNAIHAISRTKNNFSQKMETVIDTHFSPPWIKCKSTLESTSLYNFKTCHQQLQQKIENKEILQYPVVYKKSIYGYLFIETIFIIFRQFASKVCLCTKFTYKIINKLTWLAVTQIIADSILNARISKL